MQRLSPSIANVKPAVSRQVGIRSLARFIHPQRKIMSENNVELTGEQMLGYRQIALQAAATVHAGQTVPEVMHAAGCYLGFMLHGQPVTVIGQTVRETAGVPQGAAQDVGATAGPKATKPRATKPAATAEVGSAAAALAPTTPTAVAAAATPAADATPQTKVAPAAGGSGPAIIYPPTTIAEAASSLRALVLNPDNEPGRGRAAAEELLKEYKVAQLAQVPPQQLAEFKHRMDACGRTAAPAAATATDPLADLMG